MAYLDHKLVLSPKGKVANIEVIIDKGKDSYALSILDWEGKRSVGVRWNGGSDGSIGTPQSRGIPTWFILPDLIAETYLNFLLEEEKGLSNLKIDKIKDFLKKKWNVVEIF